MPWKSIAMVAKIVTLGSFALLIATATFAAADAPAWCGVENLNVVRNVDDCITSEPRTQGASGVSTGLPQVVAVPTLAVQDVASVTVEPKLVVADLPFAVAKILPMDGAQFTCIADGPVPSGFCDAMYAVASALPVGGFR